MKSLQSEPTSTVIVPPPEKPEFESMNTSQSAVGILPAPGAPFEVSAQWLASSLQLPVPPTQNLSPGGAMLRDTDDEGDIEAEGDIESDTELDGDTEEEGDIDKLIDELGDTDELIDDDGDTELDGDIDKLIDDDGDTD